MERLFFVTNSNVWKCLGIHRHFLVKDIKILIFSINLLLKKLLPILQLPVDLYNVANKQNKTFLNRAENVCVFFF